MIMDSENVHCRYFCGHLHSGVQTLSSVFAQVIFAVGCEWRTELRPCPASSCDHKVHWVGLRSSKWCFSSDSGELLVTWLLAVSYWSKVTWNLPCEPGLCRVGWKSKIQRKVPSTTMLAVEAVNEFLRQWNWALKLYIFLAKDLAMS